MIAVSLAALVILCWWYVTTAASASSAAMAGMASPSLAGLIAMWWLMMAAMMIPSAAPAILLYARIRHQRRQQPVIATTWLFVLGYLAVWLLFSCAAAAVQLRVAGPAVELLHPALASAFLIIVGAYQLSPVKSMCLRQCRSPALFLSRHWRAGAIGAVRLGVLHGAYCFGCCWLLMALLFVGGVMNLVWVVGLTLIVAIEKLVPRGDWFGRAAGVALIGWGALRLLA